MSLVSYQTGQSLVTPSVIMRPHAVQALIGAGALEIINVALTDQVAIHYPTLLSAIQGALYESHPELVTLINYDLLNALIAVEESKPEPRFARIQAAPKIILSKAVNFNTKYVEGNNLVFVVAPTDYNPATVGVDIYKVATWTKATIIEERNSTPHPGYVEFVIAKPTTTTRYYLMARYTIEDEVYVTPAVKTVHVVS